MCLSLDLFGLPYLEFGEILGWVDSRLFACFFKLCKSWPLFTQLFFLPFSPLLLRFSLCKCWYVDVPQPHKHIFFLDSCSCFIHILIFFVVEKWAFKILWCAKTEKKNKEKKNRYSTSLCRLALVWGHSSLFSQVSYNSAIAFTSCTCWNLRQARSL